MVLQTNWQQYGKISKANIIQYWLIGSSIWENNIYDFEWDDDYVKVVQF